MVVIAGDHLNEKHFPNPTRFDPDRFMGERAAESRRWVLTFSTGDQRCTGAMLGELMAVEMVSHWLGHFDLEVIRPEAVRPVARPFTQPVGSGSRCSGVAIEGMRRADAAGAEQAEFPRPAPQELADRA